MYEIKETYLKGDARRQASFLELPTAVQLRHTDSSDLFPPCEALRSWPAGFRAGEHADLNQEEMDETDPSKFVYSDGELEAWGQIVGQLLATVEGPVIQPANRNLFLQG